MTTDFIFGLEYLNTPILLIDGGFHVVYANPSAENLFAISNKQISGLTLQQLFIDPDSLLSAAEQAISHHAPFMEHELTLTTSGKERVFAGCAITPIEFDAIRLIMEFTPLDQHRRIAREERMLMQQQANKELIRNLAHEIKNPLGGIRGAAQLLEHELPRPSLREYTQVVIKEADRLQSLMDRLLTPNRLPRFASTNIHEVLERVRSLVMAETPTGIAIRRDYDTSLPEITADQEELIQALLNIVRNAVQAMQGKGEITLRTRIARWVTLAKKLHRLAIQVQVVDNGPGVPEEIRESIFSPLISGREGGTGLGLTLAQTFINQHQGTIECDSQPGHTVFTLMLPIMQSKENGNPP